MIVSVYLLHVSHPTTDPTPYPLFRIAVLYAHIQRSNSIPSNSAGDLYVVEV